MKIFIQKIVLIILIFSFSTLVLKMNLSLLSDLNEELIEKIIDADEKDPSDQKEKIKLYHFQFTNSKQKSTDFLSFDLKSRSIEKACEMSYSEPNLENPFSPPDMTC